MNRSRQLWLVMVILLALVFCELQGDVYCNLTVLPWALLYNGNLMQTGLPNYIILLPVLVYCLFLPTIFVLSLSGLIGLKNENKTGTKFLRSSWFWGMVMSIYFIINFSYQSVITTASIEESKVQREQFMYSMERDELLLELNEVCFIAREKIFLADDKGGIGEKFSQYKNDEVKLLQKIIKGRTFRSLKTIMISEITDSTITFTGFSAGDRYTLDARIQNNNTQVILEQVGLSAEEK